MSNQILMKKEIISRLASLNLQEDKINFLKWQKDNLMKSGVNDTYTQNRLQWIATQINIVRHTREDNFISNANDLSDFFK